MNSSNGSEYVFNKFNLINKIKNKFFIDIGANDGITESTTYWLASQENWEGIAIEASDEYYKKLLKNQPKDCIKKIHGKITPLNILQILENSLCLEKFGFLSLDIDSYDYFVLDKILTKFSPDIICCEINEKIPPPIRFVVNYIDDNQSWNNDHCYGASIQMFDDFKKYNYFPFYLDYNNIYMTNLENIKCDTILNIFNDGYKNKEDRKIRYYWNDNVEHWIFNDNIDLTIAQIKKYFHDYIIKGVATIEG